MQTNFYYRIGILALILALFLVRVPLQPAFAARIEAGRNLAAQAAPSGCPPTSAATFTNSTPLVIPSGPATVTSTITVSGVDHYLWDLNLLTFIQHTFSADLNITIQSPAGTVVTLTTDNGAGNDNVFNGTLWDDNGSDPVTDHIFTNLTLASPLSPEEPLGAFLGEDPNGDWIITIADDLAADGGSLNSWSLAITTAPVLPTLTTASFTNNTPVAIPSGPGTVHSTITVAGLEPYLWDLNLQTSIQHTFSADMDITIQSPAGTVVTLTSDNGAGYDNLFDGTLWDDSANDPVTDYVFTNLTLASPLSPEGPLAAFLGEDPNGDWIITIVDDLAGDGGFLNSWSLNTSTSGGCPTALTVAGTEPSSNARLSSLSSIQVTFNKNALGDGSSRAANHAGNYLLIGAGANGSFDTVSCNKGLATDDVGQTIASATYNSNTFTATLITAKPLAKGSYQLFICGTTSIWSAAGQELNYGTTDTVVDFTVLRPASSASGSTAEALPSTGFAPGGITALPSQPVVKAYAQTDLTLEIPKLGVETGIVGVPLNDDTWDVSWLGSQAGWLEGSAYPTWDGNSVITGHVWNADNTSGVFASLKTLQYGDSIMVHAFGQTYTYEVRESKCIDAAGVQTAMKHEELAWLTLITCEDYGVSGNSYSARRMVRAVLVRVE